MFHFLFPLLYFMQEVLDCLDPDFGFDSDGISGLLTTNGPLSAAKVVISAGIWSRDLCLKLGSRVPLE